MASAKKCDRCGRYYDVMGEDGRVQIKGYYLYFLKMFNTEKFCIDDLDLCPACTNSFYDWLYNTLETDFEIPEINHVNCPYRKDVVCAPNGDGNYNCTMCDVYKQIFVGQDLAKEKDCRHCRYDQYDYELSECDPCKHCNEHDRFEPKEDSE